jgi:hypothetical protein
MMIMEIVQLFSLLSISVFVHESHAQRMLQDQHIPELNQSIAIPLFLALQSIDEASASALETKDTTLPLVRGFCRAVQDQVRLYFSISL